MASYGEYDVALTEIQTGSAYQTKADYRLAAINALININELLYGDSEEEAR